MRRTEDKEIKKSRFVQSIPGIICAEQPERLKLLPLYETPTGRNNQSMRVNKPFSYQETQRTKEDLGDYLEDPEKYFRDFKGATLFYDLIWKDVMYISWDKCSLLTQKVEFWEKLLLMEINGLVMNQ